MSEKKKGGLIKRLFGGNKKSCCGVQIEEIKEASAKEKKDHDIPSKCCAPDNSQA